MLAILRSCSLVLVLVGMLFGVSDVGYAACPEDPGCPWFVGPQTDLTWKDADTVQYLNMLVEGLSFLTTPLTMLSGWLLSPDWVFGDFFGLRSSLHKMWIFVSNIVYVFFALVTVTIAFKNIVGQGKDNYEMKKAIPRLVISILIVPLSWSIVELTVAFSNVLTASVMQLPWTVIVNERSGIMIPQTRCVLDFTKQNSEKQFFYCSHWEDKTLLEFFWAWNDVFGIMSVYAYGVFDFEQIQKYDFDSIRTVKQLVDVLWQLGLSLLFFVVFALLLIGVVVALFIRALWLWLFAVGSPLFAISYFYDGKIPGFWESKSLQSFNFMGLIGLAMVPVYVGGALAFGLTFLAFVMGQGWPSERAGADDAYAAQIATARCGWDSATQFVTEYEDYRSRDSTAPELRGSYTEAGTNGDTCQVFSVGKWSRFMSIWEPGGIGSSVGDSMLGKGAIGALLVKILGLFVLWGVVMAALKSNEITRAVVEPVANALWTVAKSVPLPLPGGSLSGLQKTKDAIVALPGRYEQQKAGNIQQTWDRKFGLDRSAAATGMMSKLQLAKSADDIESAIKEYRTYVGQYKMQNTEFEAALWEKLKTDTALMWNVGRKMNLPIGAYTDDTVAKLVLQDSNWNRGILMGRAKEWLPWLAERTQQSNAVSFEIEEPENDKYILKVGKYTVPTTKLGDKYRVSKSDIRGDLLTAYGATIPSDTEAAKRAAEDIIKKLQEARIDTDHDGLAAEIMKLWEDESKKKRGSSN